MLHIFDTLCDLPKHHISSRRAAWMSLLSRSPIDLLTHGLDKKVETPFEWLRKPQCGLMMMQARVGGGGERFNFGEITVTRCTLRLLGDVDVKLKTGVAHVVGRSKSIAQLAALSDALLQDDDQFEQLKLSLLKPIAIYLNDVHAHRHAKAQSSRVSFFTVSRESGSSSQEEGFEE
jgi:alpha-D-ribose 1-methylphosphonate 5-triphosphate synthase subunit PhnG